MALSVCREGECLEDIHTHAPMRKHMKKNVNFNISYALKLGVVGVVSSLEAIERFGRP